MAKKRTRMHEVRAKKEDQGMVINMREVQKKAAPYTPVPFKTGRHMTAKDRPRVKRWDASYAD